MGLIKWIKGVWGSAKVKAFRDWMGKLFQGTLEQALAALKDIAIQAVTQVAADPKMITDDDKRNAALKIIADYAKKRGVQAGESVMRLAVELAVQDLKQVQ